MSDTYECKDIDDDKYCQELEQQLETKNAKIAELESILLSLAKEIHKSKALYDWFCKYDEGGE